MAEYAAQSITHTLVAAAVVATLLRLWRVGEPDLRVAFRLLPLLFPALVLPAFLVLAPQRSAEAFRDRWALFAGDHWATLDVGGVGVGGPALAALGLIGIGLLLVDLVRMLAERRGTRAAPVRPAVDRTEDVARELGEVARRLGARAPRLLTLDTTAAVLFSTGVRRPTVVISRGALERLDARERRAALAHEAAHLARRDPWLGWGLMAVRVALCFNPAIQIAVRLVARELEWRADDLAAAATGDREALGAALGKLSDAGGARAEWRAGDLFRRGRAAAIEARRSRLRGAAAPEVRAFGTARLAMTAGALSLLLFFVV